MTVFIKGIELSRTFYHEAVKPILDKHVPDLIYSAALIGNGSEILGYDTEMSTDHHWGPRAMLFLSAHDKVAYEAQITQVLSENLPYTFRGYSTHFGDPKHGEGDNGTQLLETINEGKINHRVSCHTIDGFMSDHLGLGSEHVMTPADWLSIPQQKLLSFTAGEVFHDRLGLQKIREQFTFYPHDVWLYLLACSWSRIGQDEHLAPRAGYVGDELGSAVMAGRLVRSIMQLCFLMEKQYAPYPKWFGTAFKALDCAPKLIPILRRVQTGDTYQQREEHLIEAYIILNTIHNALDLTPTISPAVSDFHGRPFIVSNAWRYSEALHAVIIDSTVKAIAEHTQIGNIDQFSDNTDMRGSATLRAKIATLYD